jgi:hypothetical protein
MDDEICAAVDCDRLRSRAGYCQMHYRRVQVHGSPYVNKQFKHGMTGTPEHQAWYKMVSRCTNPNDKDFCYYGARGITVCRAWLNFPQAFLKDMGNRPSPLHSLDRVDNSKGYAPTNCQWATKSQQVINRRLQKSNKSGYRGVHLDKRIMKWVATIGSGGRNHYLGTFNEPEAAARAYNQAALRYHGVAARLNPL